MKSLRWQIEGAALLSLLAMIIATTGFWFGPAPVGIAAGIIFAAWLTVLDHIWGEE